ncbi:MULTISPECIES: CaiB/BaiF CoA transferase family protein [Rhodobacterales]|jgi:crotonobetainyl-CoA:carnitine CoA-transferase CaiB-like acyl-CoA transferase|uniref:Crotonobetainyl-CoA:carnitine CoA-transferase CaiB n=3 Tax=Rhodobacterales TaxID=204455 RepID=A0A521FEZ5_9RHOB|nr:MULTISPECIES: CaiB/BaiF CoA-transferase family protein [Rhodobacterales]MBV7381025.1 CoA transferase [Maritimibacter dapengensis]MDE4176033.1 CaiB/BaiF CoA-transferase family protein [Phaeobacter sp. PT47_59]MDK3020701.1 CaiB/BaiF CoA-transferase family protein [Pseudodonghicola flavimaris]SMO94120.1 Crotonobetainyl-CoA:carnitine CoA-transferase CaiB [Thalassovita litoralis]
MSGSDLAPLSGKLVVALEQAVAAPFCSSRLADAGARVIKIERKGAGDFARAYDTAANGESAYFTWLNRGKESVALDIKADEDREILLRMLENADVFIQNLLPGALAKLGLDSASLRESFPRLVTCDITGYGEDGPMRNAKAYDLLVQCESGLASVTGTPDGPGRVGVSVCDIATGMTAHAGICEALVGRDRTGKGSGVSVAMFDVMADWMSVPLLYHDYLGKPTPRVGLNHTVICPYGAYECKDGQLVVITVQHNGEWQRFCEHILGDAALATDPRFHDNTSRIENKPALEVLIKAVFASHDRAEMLKRLDAAGIASGAVNDVATLSGHPQLDRSVIRTPSGEINVPTPPIRRSLGETALGPCPAFDAQGKALRAEFGRRS